MASNMPAGQRFGLLDAQTKGDIMSVAKVTEISASSPTSFDDAMAKGIARADKTLDKVKGAWINEMKVIVKDGKITEYRVNMKVSFILKD